MTLSDQAPQSPQIHDNERTAQQILNLTQALGIVTTYTHGHKIGNADGVHLEMPHENIVAGYLGEGALGSLVGKGGQGVLANEKHGVTLWKPTRAPRIFGDINGMHIPTVGSYLTEHSTLRIEAGINEATGRPVVTGTRRTFTFGGRRSKTRELSTPEIRHEAAKILTVARQEKALSKAKV